MPLFDQASYHSTTRATKIEHAGFVACEQLAQFGVEFQIDAVISRRAARLDMIGAVQGYGMVGVEIEFHWLTLST